MSALLRELGLEVVEVASPDVVVADLWMPTFDEEALVRIRARVPGATIAVVTALTLVDAAERVAPCGVDLLLSKSAPPSEVAAAIAAHASATV
jgi:DNA-binding NarL/FixJ family response regulator